MTKDENALKTDTKSHSERHEKEKTGRQRGPKKDKVKPPTKIVIRHLPPTMTEDEFLKQIDPLPEHDFYYFAAADWSLGYDATCRAYITLKKYDDVFLFRDRFDGYVFVDTKGAEYPAIVEFAPFQGLAKNKSRRSDNKVNTIEEEAHYQQFLIKLEEDREAAAKGGESKLEFTLDRKKEEKITSTPLLQYLANKKEKRREEAKRRTEEKRRQRDEEKEKRRQAQGQQPVTKIISNQDGGKKDDNKGANCNNSNNNNNQDERKNSRSKRRAERDQRRREEHEQRKRERDRLEREQKEKDTTGGKGEVESKGKTEESGTQQEKSEDSRQRREGGKKQGDKRERDRDRNRNRNKDKDKQNDKPKDKEKDSGARTPVQQDTNTSSTTTANSKENEVNDSVMSFIRSVASVNEFTPNPEQCDREVEQEQRTKENETDMTAVKEQLEKMSLNKGNKSENRNDTVERKQSNEGGKRYETEKQKQQQRTAEERRIRNKDRPSIAIYTPKPRMRLSEERDPKDGSSNRTDMRSNPTSDCESVKREERGEQERPKKVSRYSERRSERRAAAAAAAATVNRDKTMKLSEGDGTDTALVDVKPQHEIRTSTSCEDEAEITKTNEESEK